MGFDSTSTGNVAWAIITLLSYYKHDPNPTYLKAANDMGNWIVKNRSDAGFGGYTGGYEGWDQTNSPVGWKSTEHNLDSYIAFKMLSATATNTVDQQKWLMNSQHAKDFVISMWEPLGGYFWTGTAISNGQEIVNGSVIPLDVQDWSIMALDTWTNYISGLLWAETNCRTSSDGFDGFDFSLDRTVPSNNKNGVWFEGTGQMATAYEIVGALDKARYFISQIESAATAPIEGVGKGIPAASRDGVATGFEWQYFNRLHIGASSWLLFAGEGFDPYQQTFTPARVQSDMALAVKLLPGGGVRLLWNGNETYSFAIESCNLNQLQSNGWIERSRLTGQSGVMSWDAPSAPGQNGNGQRFYRVRIVN